MNSLKASLRITRRDAPSARRAFESREFADHPEETEPAAHDESAPAASDTHAERASGLHVTVPAKDDPDEDEHGAPLDGEHVLSGDAAPRGVRRSS